MLTDLERLIGRSDAEGRIRRNLDVPVLPFVLRLRTFRSQQPPVHGVPAIPRLPRNLGQRYAGPGKTTAEPFPDTSW